MQARASAVARSIRVAVMSSPTVSRHSLAPNTVTRRMDMDKITTGGQGPKMGRSKHLYRYYSVCQRRLKKLQTLE